MAKAPKPKLSIVYRPLAGLKPYAKNARTHSEAQVAQIAASIREFGFTNPILLDGKSGIIAGHGRLLAAKQLKMAEVPTIDLRGLSAVQVRALVLADNKLALNAGWDEELLAAELEALQAGDFDLAVIGFDEAEIASLLAESGLTDPDDVPPVPADPKVQLGDLWHLGKHRLLVGDSTSAAAVKRLLGSAKPHLMVTDPPYGVNYDPNWRNVRARSMGNGKKIGGRAIGKVMNDDRDDWQEAWALFPGVVAYVWHGALHAAAVAQSLTAVKFKIRAQIIWVKNQLVISRSHYHHQHDPAYYVEREGAKDDHWSGDARRFEEEHEDLTYAVAEGETAEWVGGRKQSTVWHIDKPRKSETGHGTQKPVECMRRPIMNNSKGGDAVYDPFLGSGTTLIASEMTGRRCFGLELDPAYGQVILERWAAFTGLDPLLDGKTPLSAILAKGKRKAKANGKKA